MGMIRKIAAGLVVLYLVTLTAWLVVMRQPTLFGRVMSRFPAPLFAVVPFRQLWFLARAGHLAVGDPAPDFLLPTSDKKSRVQLSSFRGRKPVVLIFGSYT